MFFKINSAVSIRLFNILNASFGTGNSRHGTHTRELSSRIFKCTGCEKNIPCGMLKDPVKIYYASFFIIFHLITNF